MNDQLENQTPPSPDSKPRLEPIGTVILGNIDPKTLDREQFRKSPNLLFHGAGEDFVFSRNFDYEHFDNPGGHAIGVGFYATDTKEEAELFSKARYGQHITVLETLPYQAKMLDLRRRDDPSKNAPIPQLILKEWVKYYEENFNKKHEQGGRAILEGDQSYLSNLKARSKDMNLREMLSFYGDGYITEHCIDIFTDFIKQKDYDGIIYIEGGDGYNKISPPSYVFFNLDKIGDYETWHQIPKSISKTEPKPKPVPTDWKKLFK